MCRLIRVFTFLLLIHYGFPNKVILMENFDPEKIQGNWYVVRRNVKLLDAEMCIKFNLKHDEKIEDLYAMTTHWKDSTMTYKETHFNIVDDRSQRARFFFESISDKVASNVLGTDYTGWMVGFGVSGEKETYYVASRSKALSPDHKAAVEAVLAANEVDRVWSDVIQDDCPEGH